MLILPPISYFGSKGFMAERLAAALDAVPHRHYVEACAGGLSVLLAKRKVRQETVGDLDQYLVCFYRLLRDRPIELERVCSLTPHSRAERLLSHQLSPDLPELEIARRVWVALTQGRSGTLQKSGWRYNEKSVSTPGPARLARFAQRLAPAAARIARVSLECLPAVEIIGRYGQDRDTLIYVDPPYDISPGSEKRTRNYRVEMTRQESMALAAACAEAASSVVVSGYSSPVWESALSGWWRYEIPTVTTQGGRASRRMEIVWSNRPLDGLGDDTSGRVAGLDVSVREGVHGTGSRTETPNRCRGCRRVLRQPKAGRRKTWCSPACRQKTRRRDAGVGLSETVRCRGCEAVIRPTSARRRTWCSEACRVRAWRADQRVKAGRLSLAAGLADDEGTAG